MYTLVGDGLFVRAGRIEIGSGNSGPAPDVTLAPLPDGGFVAVWTSDDGDGHGVSARYFDLAGTAAGASFLVNQVTQGNEDQAGTALLASGKVAVSFSEYYRYTQLARTTVLDPGASYHPTEYALSVSTGVSLIATSALAGGGSVTSFAVDRNGAREVHVATADASGLRSSDDLTVAVRAGVHLTAGDVAGLSDGGFVVTWTDPAVQVDSQTGAVGSGVRAQRYDATAHALGDPIDVSGGIAGAQDSSVAALPDGGFVVVWSEVAGEAAVGEQGLWSRIVDAAGNAVGDPVHLDTGADSAPTVEAVPGRGFIVGWEQETSDGDASRVMAGLFDSTAYALGQPFAVAPDDPSPQTAPAMTVLQGGDLVIAWADTDAAGHSTPVAELIVPEQHGSGRADTLAGDAGRDAIDGRGGDDLIVGVGGDDELVGGAGLDRLDGGDGNDELDGGPDSDRIEGGTGVDTVVFASGLASSSVHYDADGSVVVTGPDGRDVLTGVEALSFNDGQIATADGPDIAAQYLAWAGRDPTAAEIGYWTDRLTAGLIDQDGVRRAILADPIGQAHTAEQVTSLYEAYAGRMPAAEELAVWQGLVRDGDGFARVREVILTDPIGYIHTISTLDGLYQTYAGRAPSEDEIGVWQGLLVGGADFSTVRNTIIDDPIGQAYATTTITALYDDYAGRDPTTDELGYWRQAIRLDGADYSTVRQAILADPIGQSHTTAEVSHQYRTFFGRDATADEQSVWHGLIAGGATFPVLTDTLLRDALAGEAGTRHLAGSDGSDTFDLTGDFGHVVIDGFDPAHDTIDLGDHGETVDALPDVQVSAFDGSMDVLVSFDDAHVVLIRNTHLADLSAANVHLV